MIDGYVLFYVDMRTLGCYYNAICRGAVIISSIYDDAGSFEDM